MSVSIIDSAGEWPCPLVSGLRHRGDPSWVEMDEERYWHFLEVLPPLYFAGGFMVSEAAAHDSLNNPIYAAVVKVGSRYFMREMTRAVAPEAARELRDAVEAGAA